MNKRQLLFLRCGKVIFPLCFVLPGIINLIFYYLGQSVEGNLFRKYGFIGGNILYAIVAGVTLMLCIKNKKLSKRLIIIFACLVIYFVGCFCVSWMKFGIQPRSVDYFEQFICFCLPALAAGICGTLFKGEKSFGYIINKLSLFALPAVLIYLYKAIFDEDNFLGNRNLGLLNYMNVAYIFMPFLMAEVDWLVTNGKEKIKNKFLLVLWHSIFTVMLWYAILASGTRGTYICIIAFCFMYLAIRLLKKKEVKVIGLITFLLTFFMFFNIYIYECPGLYAVSRMKIFLDGLAQNQFVTSVTEEKGMEHLENVVEMEMEEGKIVLSQEGETVDGEQQEGQSQENVVEMEEGKIVLSQEGEMVDGEQQEGQSQENVFKMANRGSYYKVAIKEFLNSPIIGMGPMGYSVKYGTYPHNVILELLCELGLIGAVPLLLLIIFVLFKIYNRMLKCEELEIVFLFFIIYALYANMSGTIWTCKEVFGALGYSLTYCIKTNKTKNLDVGEVVEK